MVALWSFYPSWSLCKYFSSFIICFKGAEKKTKEWQVSGLKKQLSIALSTEGDGEMKSALEDDKPLFLVELIQTVVSTVETWHRQSPHHTERGFQPLNPQSHIQLFTRFSSVLLHYSIRTLKCTQTAGISCHSKFFQCGYGSDNNVSGSVGGAEREAKLNPVSGLRPSCLWKLVDVGQVGVVQDYFDPIQGLRLSYSLQLDLRTKNKRQFWFHHFCLDLGS